MRALILLAAAALAYALPMPLGGMRTVHRYADPPGYHGTWNAQVCQDITIALDVFDGEKGGFYVDLAANAPVYLSNTYALDREYGWGGVCIEANEKYIDPLIAERGCAVVHGVVGARDGDQITFGAPTDKGEFGQIVRRHGTGPSGKANFGPSLKRRAQNGAKIDTTTETTVSLKTILRTVSAPKVIDYLSLDVEGAEQDIMSTFPWDEYTFMSATIERPPQELVADLERRGYTKMLDHGSFGDTLFIHESHPRYGAIMTTLSGIDRVTSSMCARRQRTPQKTWSTYRHL